jgi:SRSO17 transposase
LARSIAPRFPRFEAWQRARDYLKGLLSNVERKNGWQLSEHLGEVNPYGLQHLLGRAKWDADQVRDDLQHYVIRWLGDKEGVLVVDESGFLKKGNKSAGVARQYSGTAGKVENCQIGVFLCYATKYGHTFLDRALYLPKEWTDDKERCKKAGIPEQTVFASKPKLARQMLERAFAAGVVARWVTGDAVYGNDRSLQLWLQHRRQAHVLCVSGQETVTIGWQPYRVKDLLAQVPEDAWQIRSAGEGAKGPRLYEWARLAINCAYAPEWERWLLVRRSLSDPEELTGYIAFAPTGTSLEGLVRVAGRRWSIESCFESGKGEVGMDHYEVRSWHGWHRHMTLSMLAHAYLTRMRAMQPAIELQGQARIELVEVKGSWEAAPAEAEPVGAKRGLWALPASNPTGSLEAFKRGRGLSCR